MDTGGMGHVGACHMMSFIDYCKVHLFDVEKTKNWVGL